MTDFHRFMRDPLSELLKKSSQGLPWDANNDFVPTGGKEAGLDEHLNALWYLLRNSCAWRALPSEFGPWPAIHQYFNRLSKAGYFEFLQAQLISGNTAEAVFMDSTHCKVHQHSNGPGTPEDQAIGKSRGGLNTKIHLVVDELGRLAAPIVVTQGNVSDITPAPALLAELADTAVVGDKGYDSRSLRDTLRGQHCEPCIPARRNVKHPEPYDEALYRTRDAVKMCFNASKCSAGLPAGSKKPNACFSPSSVALFPPFTPKTTSGDHCRQALEVSL